ncbi:flagellin [Tardiphaga sp.]|uniref:flagellin N-terminal helical domain-containing protein n=1 Tax=Tardiphaga sp. TaxID=1926292 RepID=UPI0026053802|nr:flagellin [Tardiphaga sp.]MDB5617109.1 Flagellin [Tardiphaga sp.]
MSGIVLSASVRQNLLSLQNTAELLSTTQNRLSTGKKVNTALDNPTNFFTAAALDSRSGDINNLLDGIGNGVQVLQAANTGITSLQKLVDTAKSIANQALQIPVGYSSKSTITTPINPGATSDNLLGASNPVDNTFDGSVVNSKLTVVTAITGATLLSGAANSDSLSTSFAANDTITVNGQSLTFKASGASGANEINIGDTVTVLLGKIDALSGGTGSAVAGGKVTLHTGTASDLKIVSSNTTALAALGLGTSVTATRTPGPTALGGPPALTLSITATNTSSIASNITFGTAAGQVSTLAQLNAALAPNNLQAVLDPTGFLTITTSNDAASSSIGTVGGSAAGAGKLFNGLTATTPVTDYASQTSRANLVAQYNNIIDQITTTSQDASFNGINLLAGDQLKLVFNETGKSTLNIAGTTLTPAGLGLRAMTKNVDFLDNTSANTTLDSLNIASSVLRSQASALGSNLSIVQIRQDFAKNLINVLSTGSSNLTLADTNEEAANSQALSTRQSIAVSALALANTSQQSVLQLLR